MTNNRWFEVYITDGLDKYYEKSTILRIYILTLRYGGAPLDIGDRINLNHSTMVEGVLFNIGFNI